MVSFNALGAFAAVALAIGSSPALANETATATQISAAVAGAPAAAGDAEFAQLFASWKSLDGDSAPAGQMAVAPMKVSVPSGMPLGRATLTSNYGMRTHPILGGARKHDGIDLAAPTGTPVYAPADGFVSRASRFGSYGNFIQIQHGGDLETRYGHLSGYAVAAGQQVHKGDLIGYVGTTGRSTGPHLHYEVRVAGAAVDPSPYLADTQLAVNETDPKLGRGGPSARDASKD
jgi:murein DD-endopeptidase MepM/ murein hydrolase activator NlpD